MLKGNLPEGKLDGELECPTEDTDKPLGKHYAFKSVKRISALIGLEPVDVQTNLKQPTAIQSIDRQWHYLSVYSSISSIASIC